MASHYVTFRYNGNGTGVSGVPSASTSYYNNTSGQYPYTVYKKLGSAPSRNYYKFKGWARSSGSSAGSSAGSNYSVLIPTADTASVTYDFYATWEHVNVTCTFNANGGSGAPNPITHWGGYSIDIPSTVPTRSGYTFVGWALSADATSASYYAGQQEVPLYGNVTLYAVWSPANSQIASVTSSVPIDGSTQGTLTITRYVSSYTHTVTIQLSSTYKLTFNNVGTSLSFTLPTSWLAGVPNATSAAVTVTVTTLNGSTQVGSAVSQTITATVPASVKPTISSVTPTFVNSNPVVDGWGILLQGYSQLQLAVSASAGSGASIQSYTFTGSAISKTVTTASAITDTLPADGSQTWTVTVTDSRGRTASQTYTATVYTYAAPSIESVTANRSDSTGVTDVTSGTYLHAMGKYVFSDANGNNTVSSEIRYKRHTDTSWTVGQSDAASETWYTFGGGGIDIDKAFDVELVVTDALGSSATYIVVVQSVVGYSFGLKNDRVRFGGVVQKAGFQNDLDLEQNGDAVFNGGFDITNRRSYAQLNSAGWYRAIKIANEGRGGVGFVLDINITRSYSNASNEVHKIHLLGCWNNFVFVDEASRSNALRVSKIRYTRDADNNGYVDIYFNSSNWENVSVDFVPHTQGDYMYEITAESLQAVSDAPSGETVLTTYNMFANTDRSLTVSNSNCTARFYAIGGVKAVRIADPKGLTANAVTTLVSASEMADYMPVGSYAQDCVSMNSAMERVRFYVDSSGIRAYNYSSNTGTLNMELTITYV